MVWDDHREKYSRKRIDNQPPILRAYILEYSIPTSISKCGELFSGTCLELIHREIERGKL